MSEKKFNRRVIREKALLALYAFEMNGDGLDELIEGMFVEVKNENDKSFGKSLIAKVIANRKDLDEMIREKVNNWEMERIALIDRILLRIAIAELLYFPDIPPKVSINEAIEIAKEYSTAKSGKFINGVLDAILTDLKQSGKLNKSGRGLIEESLPKKIQRK
jgi:N utilization substance protein B